MKAKVNEGCISCGFCVGTCPEVFRFNENEISEAYGPVTEDNLKSVQEARDGCPVAVIDIEE